LITNRSVFVTGGTGFIGRPLIEALVARGWMVHALVRRGSERRLPPGATPVIGDALDPSTFASAVPNGATVVHLVGTPHPNPSKAAEFRDVDLASIKAVLIVAQPAQVRHLVYLSVAHETPVMRAYVAVRQEGEALIRKSGIPATFVRPLYVIGPGRFWPALFLPVYAIFRLLPATRDRADRLGLVTRRAMVAVLRRAVEEPPTSGIRVVEIPEIRRSTWL
jgi:uncharacterized protein YbjT (DUF2867 family)